jgi:hypothetical protein
LLRHKSARDIIAPQKVICIFQKEIYCVEPVGQEVPLSARENVNMGQEAADLFRALDAVMAVEMQESPDHHMQFPIGSFPLGE